MGRQSHLTISAALLALGGTAQVSCSERPAPPTTTPATSPALTPEQRLDPATCQGCHSAAYSAWSGSMHAYASDDPLFVAMNARFQRETGGKSPTFCVQCHAPLALRTGATSDGMNLALLAPSLHGVTCDFCHSVDSVNGDNDDPLALGSDGVMHGPIADAVPAPHASAYSSIHDGAHPEAASMCGSCHDVRTPAGVNVETTFAEWKGGIFSQDVPLALLTCAGCHMTAHQGPAADAVGAPIRSVHDHSFVGADTATTPFPNVATQQALIQAKLDNAVIAKLCVASPKNAPDAAPTALSATFTLDNVFVGHSWPSGASHDRRAWVELIAYAGAQIVYHSGVIQGGEDVTQLTDPDLWLMREKLFDLQSNEVRMMWQAATTSVMNLPVTITLDPNNPRYVHAVSRTFTVPSMTDRITTRLRMTPVGLDVVADLVTSGDLDPSYGAKIPIYTIGTTALTWTRAGDGFACIQ